MSSEKSGRSRSQITDTKDMIIQQLKRELEEFKNSQGEFDELISKVESLEHLNHMITDEKRRNEEEAAHKNDHQIKLIGELKAEIDTLSLRNGEIEYELQNLEKQNEWFEEALNQKNTEFIELENLLSLEGNRNGEIESELKKLKTENRDFEIEKDELTKTIDRHNAYIDELMEALKERDEAILELEKEKEEYEEDQLKYQSELEKAGMEIDNLTETADLFKKKINEGTTERNMIEDETITLRKQLDIQCEENKQLKRRIEALREQQNDLENELKNQLKRVELLTSTLDIESEKIEQINEEKANIIGQLTNIKSDNDIYRRELEKVAMDHKEIMEEVYRFKNITDTVKSEQIKKKNLEDHREQSDKELKRALESLNEAMYYRAPLSTRGVSFRPLKSGRRII